MNGVIHITGPSIEMHGRYLRQRCAWCGAILLDYDLTRVVVADTPDGRPLTWHTGTLVLVDGDMKVSVDHDRATIPLPPNACVELDPAVTA